VTPETLDELLNSSWSVGITFQIGFQ
jgi:hypothetical protein